MRGPLLRSIPAPTPRLPPLGVSMSFGVGLTLHATGDGMDAERREKMKDPIYELKDIADFHPYGRLLNSNIIPTKDSNGLYLKHLFKNYTVIQLLRTGTASTPVEVIVQLDSNATPDSEYLSPAAFISSSGFAYVALERNGAADSRGYRLRLRFKENVDECGDDGEEDIEEVEVVVQGNVLVGMPPTG
ncbi:hypothetical protein B0H16DRAFT_1488070 [Mycena metata]|uniref:Uncharacterized protein n=1 Tax=Mycena metata TaxID=1033252 RepID=A0AAD7P338_9AGAR|nr:hypothetical protein B0H16DRAFT_1488070 [Mycena metata]